VRDETVEAFLGQLAAGCPLPVAARPRPCTPRRRRRWRHDRQVQQRHVTDAAARLS
jgi:hypothetical protein